MIPSSHLWMQPGYVASATTSVSLCEVARCHMQHVMQVAELRIPGPLPQTPHAAARPTHASAVDCGSRRRPPGCCSSENESP